MGQRITGLVGTALGDIDADQLGVTNSHDHLFFRTPALPGQELDDVPAAMAEARAFAAAGGRTIVQWTPRGLGRHRGDLDAFERVSLEAAALAHDRTGVPVAIHLELGTAGNLVFADRDQPGPRRRPSNAVTAP